MATPAIIASRPQDTIGNSVGNAGLRLAEALQGASDELAPVLQSVGKEIATKQSAKAHADAMTTQGMAFADAVRAGKIEKTQNPWYIQAYEKGAAGVRGRAAVATLLDESQTWASRTDPAAYQKEFSQRVGELEQQYQANPDQAAGFRAAADPLVAQGLQQNVQFNVQRINEEHVQNVSTMATTNIQAVTAQNGGKPTAAQVFAAIEPQHQSWIATGGTEADWNQMAINSVIGAAFNSSNSSLLNVLDDPRGGKGALANIAGPDGKPIAQDLATARYRIEAAEDQGATREIRARLNAVKAEGGKAVQDVWDTHGAEFLKGTISRDTIVGDLQAKGYSPQSINFAITELGKDAAGNQAFTRALMGADPQVLDLYTEGRTKGLTANVIQQTNELVRTGRLSVDEAEQIRSAGQSRTDHNDSERRADARAAKSDARAAASQERMLTLQSTKNLKTSREEVAATVALRMSQAGSHALVTPKARKAFEQGLEDAEGNHLLANPGDYVGAQKAVQNAAAQYIRLHPIKRPTGAAPKAASGGSNPRS